MRGPVSSQRMMSCYAWRRASMASVEAAFTRSHSQHGCLESPHAGGVRQGRGELLEAEGAYLDRGQVEQAGGSHRDELRQRVLRVHELADDREVVDDELAVANRKGNRHAAHERQPTAATERAHRGHGAAALSRP